MIQTNKRYKKGNALIDKSKEQNVWVYHQKSESVVLVSTDPNFNSAEDMYYANERDLVVVKKQLKQINKVSLHKKKEDKIYSTLRKIFLDNHTFCCAKLYGCTIHSTQIHHMAGRIGNRYLDINNFLAVCDSCHKWIEVNVEKAKEMGFSLNRI